ncbi:MAG TPA: hypothetical protein VHY08_05240 [Bacillota bacterium]|nr:hypothetical protein [Bacillota bacterium]
METKDIIILLAVVAIVYFTAMILFLKNKLMENNKLLNNLLMETLKSKYGETETTLKQNFQTADSRHKELMKALAENKETVLSSLNQNLIKMGTAIQSGIEALHKKQSDTETVLRQQMETAVARHRELVQVLSGHRDTVLSSLNSSETKISAAIQNNAAQITEFRQSLKVLLEQFQNLDRALTGKTDLMHKDYERMLEMLKAVWMSDLIKDMESMKSIIR